MYLRRTKFFVQSAFAAKREISEPAAVRLNLGKLGSELPPKPSWFPSFRTVLAVNPRKCLIMERLQKPTFGTVLAVL